MNILGTLQKARKAAEDEKYILTDETQLGKGHRKKIVKRYSYSATDSEEDNEDNVDNEKLNSHVKSKGQEMPQWPQSMNEDVHHTSPTLMSAPSTNTYNEEQGIQFKVLKLIRNIKIFNN